VWHRHRAFLGALSNLKAVYFNMASVSPELSRLTLTSTTSSGYL
jgi:hypothetical protein